MACYAFGFSGPPTPPSVWPEPETCCGTCPQELWRVKAVSGSGKNREPISPSQAAHWLP